MSFEIKEFEQHHLEMFEHLAEVTRQKKKLEETEAKIKKNLEEAMVMYDIKSIDNEYVRITRVEESKSVSIDMKEFQKKEPQLYAELLNDYAKTTTKKSYLMFKVK